MIIMSEASAELPNGISCLPLRQFLDFQNTLLIGIVSITKKESL